MALTHIALLGLFAPVLTLILGNILNDESLNICIITGTAMIVLSIYLHEFLPTRFDKPVI